MTTLPPISPARLKRTPKRDDLFLRRVLISLHQWGNGSDRVSWRWFLDLSRSGAKKLWPVVMRRLEGSLRESVRVLFPAAREVDREPLRVKSRTCRRKGKPRR